jgi:hypothetical protein
MSEADLDYMRRNSYWAPLLDVLPAEVIAKMDKAMHDATWSKDSRANKYDEAVLISGVRALVAHFADYVSRDEHVDRMRNAFNDYMRELKEVRETAEEKAKQGYADGLRQAEMRNANVQALVWRAGKRKTMQTAEVRAAIDWDLGEEIPQVTREEYERIYGLKMQSIQKQEISA